MAGEGGGGSVPYLGPILGSLFKGGRGVTAGDVQMRGIAGLAMLGYTGQQAIDLLFSEHAFRGDEIPRGVNRVIQQNVTLGQDMVDRARRRGYFTEYERGVIGTMIDALRAIGVAPSVWENSPAWPLYVGSAPPALPSDPGQVVVPTDDTAPPVVITDPSQTPASQPPSGQAQQQPSIIEQLYEIWLRWQEWKQRKQQQGWQINIPMPSMPGIPATVPGTPNPYYKGDDELAYINTSLLAGGEGGGWSNVISQALRTAQNIWGSNQAMPGGASINYLTNGGSFFDIPGIDIVSQGTGSCMSNLTSPFSSGSSRGARAKTHVQCDPITGRPVWFKPAGRPILWSGDLSATKRVRKVAARARRARGGR